MNIQDDFRIKYQHKIKEFEDHIESLNETKKEYKRVIGELKKLPDTLTQNTRVPLGKYAFFEGQLVETNEIMILLGDNYFAQRSSKQTIDIIQRREKDINENIKNVKHQIESLKQRMTLTSDLSNALKQKDDIREIKEEYDSDEERKKKKEKESKEKENIMKQQQLQKQDKKVVGKVDKEREEELEAMFARLLELEKKEEEAIRLGKDLDVDEDQEDDDDEDNDDEYEDVVEYYDEEGNRIEVAPEDQDEIEYVEEEYDQGGRYQDDEEFEFDDNNPNEYNDEFDDQEDDDENNQKELYKYLQEKRTSFNLKQQEKETKQKQLDIQINDEITNSPKSNLKQQPNEKKQDINNPIDFIKKLGKQVSFGDIQNDVSKANAPKDQVFSGEIIEKDSSVFEVTTPSSSSTSTNTDNPPKVSRFKSSRQPK